MTQSMNRRTFGGVLAAAALTRAVPAYAQAAGTLRVAWISTDRATGNTGYETFLLAMRDRGYVEGRNLTVDARWGDGALEALAPVVADVVRTRPDVIVTQGPVIRIVAQNGTAIPVVFAFSGDPLEAGLVQSFARPGRSFTGVSFMSLDLVGKRIEIVKDAVPGLRRLGIIANQGHAGEQSELRASNAAAAKVGLTVEYFPMKSAADLSAALDASAAKKCDAIVVFPDAGMMRRAPQVAEFARRHRIPAVSGWAVFARAGNLLSYGPNLEVCFARLAYYVDRIAKGAKPADLPIELPTKVELVINLRTATDLGVTIPQTLILRADELIE